MPRARRLLNHYKSIDASCTRDDIRPYYPKGKPFVLEACYSLVGRRPEAEVDVYRSGVLYRPIPTGGS